MAQSNIWDPDNQFDLDPETGQYVQRPSLQTAAPAGGGGTDWASVEQQLRARASASGLDYDPSDLEGIQRHTGYNEGGQTLEQALQNQYNIYGQRAATQQTGGQAAPQQATSQYSGGTPAGAGDAALSQFMQMIQSRDAQQQQQQAALREILMSQLAQAQQPVSEKSPGIREVLAGQRLGLQRGAERERKNAAELRAYDGSGGLGGKAFDSDVSGILQRQGEADAMMTGNVLNQQLQRQEDKLQRLLTVAMQLGDVEAARSLQAQLEAIQTQLGQSNFYDTQALSYANLNQQGNLQSLMALLGAV